jgi:hypothetical protein
LLWRNVRDVLREGPSVHLRVLGGVLALAKRCVVRRLHNPRAKSLRVFEVSVDVLDMDNHVLVDLAGARRAVLAGLTPEHDGALGHDQLGVTHDAIPFGAEALGESKGSAEPVDRLADVLIDQEWNNRCGGRGSIDNHVRLLNRLRCRAKGLGRRSWTPP